MMESVDDGLRLSLEPPPPKPFLGGYRHKRTGAEYHHASAQTDHKKKAPKDVCSMYYLYRVTHWVTDKFTSTMFC